MAIQQAIDFERYRDDPAAFGRELLHETYTPDVLRVMESVRDNVVTVAKSGNGVGKTHGAARVAVWFFKVFSDSQVYTAAAPPEDNLRRLLWGEMGNLVVRNPHVFFGDRVLQLHIERNPQSFITAVTIPASGTSQEREAKFSGKHAPHILFIVDEGDAVPDEVYRGIEACMSGGHARLLIMFNPRAMSGAPYRMERDSQAHVVELSAFRHPNVVTGQTVIPGAVDREKTVRRINQWSVPLRGDEQADLKTFEIPAYLVGVIATGLNGIPFPPLPAVQRKIVNPALAYMTLGQYPDQAENSLISRSWIQAARARYDNYVALYGETPQPTNPEEVKAGEPASYPQPIMGLDVAEFGNDLCVETTRYGGLVLPLKKWGQTDPDRSASIAAVDAKAVAALQVQVDGTGVGAGVAPAMVRKDVLASSVKVASSPTFKTEMGEFAQLRDQLWWSVMMWLRDDPTAMLPPDENLEEELATPTYTIKAGKIKVLDKDTMKEILHRSPDSADSLCLTFAPDSAQLWI